MHCCRQDVASHNVNELKIINTFIEVTFGIPAHISTVQ